MKAIEAALEQSWTILEVSKASFGRVWISAPYFKSLAERLGDTLELWGYFGRGAFFRFNIAPTGSRRKGVKPAMQQPPTYGFLNEEQGLEIILFPHIH